MPLQEELATMPTPESSSSSLQSSLESSIIMQRQPSETPIILPQRQPLLHHRKCGRKLSIVTSAAHYRSRPTTHASTTTTAVTHRHRCRSHPHRALTFGYGVPCHRQFQRIVTKQQTQAKHQHQEEIELSSLTTNNKPVSNAPAASLSMSPIYFRGTTCYVCVVMPRQQCNKPPRQQRLPRPRPNSMVRVSRGIGVPTLTEAKAIIATVATTTSSSSSVKKDNATTDEHVTIASACSVTAVGLSDMKL